jgi:hypothetical protein
MSLCLSVFLSYYLSGFHFWTKLHRNDACCNKDSEFTTAVRIKLNKMQI